MTTLFAAAFTVAAIVPVVVLIVRCRRDLRSRYYPVRRAPLRVPVALELHHHGRLAVALRDWSAWASDQPVANVSCPMLSQRPVRQLVGVPG